MLVAHRGELNRAFLYRVSRWWQNWRVAEKTGQQQDDRVHPLLRFCLFGFAPVAELVRVRTKSHDFGYRDGELDGSLTTSATLESLAHQLLKFLEKMRAVVRAGGRLGVILDAHDRPATVPHPFERTVVQIDVR